MNSKYILAHRGALNYVPENTDIAFEFAHKLAFDGVELDVHQTKDNELVIIHDEDTLRTCEKNLLVGESTLAELKKLNHAAQWGKMGNGIYQSILTLAEFLDSYLDKFKFINIEIKTDVTHYDGIEQRIADILNKYTSAKEKIILSSFNFESLEIIHKINSNYKLGFLWWKQSEYKKIDKNRIKAICSYLNPWLTLYNKPELKKDYDSIGLPYCMWTIKTKKDYINLINDNNVDYIISNYKF